LNPFRQTRESTVVLLLLSLSFGVISIPFLMGAADSWDMVGHLAHAQMQRQMLPQLVFWNPYFYSGYEQFTAYPPLFSLLVALVSIPLGLVSAFKLVTAISWMALPASLHFLYRGILDNRRALVGTTISTLILVLWPQQIGGTFFSTLVVGNVANALGLVFFLLCMGFVLRGDLRRAIPLLALLTITHMIAAVVLSLFIGAKLLLERRGWVLLLGYGMAAFWLMPALLDTFRDVSTHDDYPLAVFEYAAYVVLVTGYLWYRRRSEDRGLDFLVVGLAVLFFLVGVLRHLSMDLWQSVPMHFHRVKVYSLVVMVPVFLRMISGRRRQESETRNGSIWMPAMSLLAGVIIVIGAFGKPYVFRQPYEPPELEIAGERVMTVEELPKVPYWHNFRYHLASLGHMVSKGLFIEASPDAPILLSLEQILDREHQVPLRWGIDWDSRVMADPDVEGRIPFLLDVLGIQAIVTDRALASESVGIPGPAAVGYTVIERPDQNLVDRPEYPIKFSGGPSSHRHWQTLTRQWFLEGSELLVVDSASFATSGQGSARLASSDLHYNTLEIEVDATEPIPVYVRMGHSDKWHAYSGGAELSVYRVTPNNLMVLTSEDFELHFEPLNRFNWAGLAVSILSLMGWGVFARREAI
jgi:hypothetical protein